MKIPNQVKVGGITYSVSIIDSEDFSSDHASGRLSTDRRWIQILRGDEEYMQESFLHELFHAINAEIGETTIEFLAQALYQIIVDNPKIFEGGENSHGRKKE